MNMLLNEMRRPTGKTRVLFLALATIALAGCQGTTQGTTDTTPALGALTEFKSADGVLTATLEAAAHTVKLGDVTINGMMYNGDYAGPVLRVHPGDVMKIKLVNHLTEPTNLHFHGYEGSPLGNSDNMHIVVKPGEMFDYEIKIPVSQPPGFYWYHAHLHGLAERQIMGGLSGAMVVEGLTRELPQLAGLEQKLFVFKEYMFDPDDSSSVPAYYHHVAQSINGQIHTTIAMHPGESQLWRFSNQSASSRVRLSLQKHVFHILAEDGVALTKKKDADTLDVMPSGRVEALIEAGDAGSYDLVALGVPTGTGEEKSGDRILGRLTVAGEPNKPADAIARFPERLDLRTKKIDAERMVVFTENAEEGHYYMDGKLFDHTRTDTRVPLGNTEIWTVRNDTDDFHVFHIHQVHFQVIEINHQPQEFKGYLDSVYVPERGEVKIIIPFTNPLIVGSFMYHCHVLEHEDKGMMAIIEVYDPHNSSTANATHDHSM